MTEMPALLRNLPKSLRTLSICILAFNQGLHHVRLPPGLQSLTFGTRFNQSLDKCDMASRPVKGSDFWFQLQSEPGQRDMASRPSKS